MPSTRTLVILLIGIVIAAVWIAVRAFNAVKVDGHRQANAIIQSQHYACLSSSRRLASELNLAWTVYYADELDAATSRSPRDILIRGDEARGLLANMVGIASARVDVGVAWRLPTPLSEEVLKVGFSCAEAYPLRRPG